MEPLFPEATYHIYNRANGSEKLFLSDENYSYFLRKFQEYILPIAEVYCYCLMPNHFHFLLKIKTETELLAYFGSRQKPQGFMLQNPQGFKNLEGLIGKNLEALSPAALPELLSKQFSNFFNGYSKAFNKQHNRMGSLFMHPFKRKPVGDSAYLRQLVIYIHLNPIEAGLCYKPTNWPHSSYGILISNCTTFLKRNNVIEWFNDQQNFQYCHGHFTAMSTFDL